MTATQARRIDEVAVVFNGKTPSKSEQRDGGHPVLKIKDVDALGRFRGMFSGYVDADLARKHVKQQLAGGETLVLNAAHSATHVASKTFYADQDVAGSLATGEWLIVRWSTEAVDSRYGNHWINVPDTRFRIRRLVNGIHLYPKDVARLQIPLPPLDQQKRIARILDAADALRAKRREALAQLDTLLQSTFLDMFGDPVTNSNIPSAIMTELVTKFIDYRGKSPEKSKGGVPLITAKIVKEKEVKEPNEFIPANSYDAWMRRGIPNPGDVVITTEAPMGEVALVPDYKAAFAQRLLVLQPDETKVKSIYLMWALTMPFVIRQLRQRSTGSTVTGIRSREFKKVTLPIPSLDLQRRFAAIVESVEQQKTSQRTHMAELDTLFTSLQARAFRGHL